MNEEATAFRKAEFSEDHQIVRAYAGKIARVVCNYASEPEAVATGRRLNRSNRCASFGVTEYPALIDGLAGRYRSRF